MSIQTFVDWKEIRRRRTMATTFHAFEKLPAELRASIWDYTLQDEKAKLDTQSGRTIQLLNYDPDAGIIAVATSTSYPMLFAVDREARYEAAKLDGCEWITIHARYRGYDQVSAYDSFKVCVNFSKDLIYIPATFLKLQQRNAWVSETHTPENYHLKALARLLDAETINKIEHLSVSTAPPAKGPRYLEDCAWWRGEGLDMFCLGNLKSVHVFSIRDEHAKWVKMIVEDYLEHYRVTARWKGECPVVTVTERRSRICTSGGRQH
jgi:hypothetical protein